MIKRIIGLSIALLFPSIVMADFNLNYNPPKTGAPLTRIGGGTRSLAGPAEPIQVLAPNHTALTAHAQPVLYWFLSEVRPEAIEVSLIKEKASTPFLERTISTKQAVGVQKFSLKDYGVSLTEGEEYRWTVSYLDAEGKAVGDEITSGTIRYQPPESKLSLKQQAEAGYWYDVLDHLVEAKSPEVPEFLKQIGLDLTMDTGRK